MNRLLLFLFPNKHAMLIAVAVSFVAFLLGVVHMLSREYDTANSYLHLSIGILVTLFLLKYLATRATYQVAQHAQAQLHHRIKKIRQTPKPKEKSEAEQRAQEKAEMAELADQLRQALHNIAPESPVRPKYEATLELMERVLHKS